MGSLKIVLICLLGLSFLPGGIKSGKIMKDDCSSRFLSSLIEAGHEIDNTVDLTLNLKYVDEEGAKKKAAIKLRDQCKEPRILCDGETDIINEEMVTGPLLSCSWKWNEKDETTKNYVIVRLNHKKAIEISGSISQDSETVFPHASDRGPLDFKFITPKWNSEEVKKTDRVKRDDEEPYDEEEDKDESEDIAALDSAEGPKPQRPRPTPPPPVSTTTGKVTSKAQSIFHVTNKLTYVLWTMGASFLMYALK